MHPIKISGGSRRGRCLSALVAVVAAIGLLAGCGGSSSKSSSTSAGAATSSSTSANTSTSGAASTTTSPTSGSTSAGVATAWTQPNGDLAGTRDVQSSINSSNVNQLGVAWKVPISGKAGTFGNFASNAVVVNGIAYFQDLDSGVYAVNVKSGKVLWHTQYHSENIGPNGVNVADGKVYGATATNAFALSAATGEQLW